MRTIISKPVTMIILALFAIASIATVMFYGDFLGIDDAHIFFSYAENLASGHGISYAHNNTPVEGCTSLLWLFICAINFAIGFDEIGVLITSILVLLATQWIWLKIIRIVVSEDEDSWLWQSVYAMLILSSVFYFSWMSASLMDCAIWGLIIAWLTLVLLQDINPKSNCDVKGRTIQISTALPFILAPWTRPESMLIVPGCISLMLACNLIKRNPVRRPLIFATLFLLSTASITIFRIWYFGYPLPNTFYAKVSPSLSYNLNIGLHYAIWYLRSGIVVPVFAACFIAKAISFVYHPTMDRDSPLWLWCLILCASPILAGGDHFKCFRFFQPAYPVMCVLITVILASIVKCGTVNASMPLPMFRKLLIIILMALTIPFLWWRSNSWAYVFTQYSPKFIEEEFSTAKDRFDRGILLSRIFDDIREKPALGVIAAGGVARTYSGPIVDLMGLNDTTVAHYPGERKGIKNHAAFEPGVFNQLNVDIMVFPPDKRHTNFLKGLCTNDTFTAIYRYVRISRKDNAQLHVDALARREYLNSLPLDKFRFYDLMKCNEGVWSSVEQ